MPELSSFTVCEPEAPVLSLIYPSPSEVDVPTSFSFTWEVSEWGDLCGSTVEPSYDLYYWQTVEPDSPNVRANFY